MDSLQGAVVVVTGASSGIGRATAEAFAREGAWLVLAARSRPALEEVAARCRALGGEAHVVPTDVTLPSAVVRLAERALAFGGRIDVWVSNVGSGAVGLYERVPMAVHEQVIRVNLLSHMNEAHAALPIFRRQGRGVFVNMISLGAFAATPYAAAYAASKFALKGFSEALRGELSDEPHIHVCDIYPTFVDTPGLRHAANYTGRALSAPPPVYGARTVARAIVDLARRPRPTRVVGAPAHLIRLGHFLAPELSARIAAWMMGSYFGLAERAPITNGRLYEGQGRSDGIDGGLRSPAQRQAAVAIGCAAAFAAAGAIALSVFSRDRAPRRR